MKSTVKSVSSKKTPTLKLKLKVKSYPRYRA